MALPALLKLFREQLENESASLAERFGLQKRGDRLIYWYFTRLECMGPSEIEEIVCDDGGDLGIDALRIDSEDFVHFYQFKNPEDPEAGFPGGDVDKVISGLHLILNRDHEKVANAALKAMIDQVYQIVPAGYRIHLVTSGSGLACEPIQKLNTFVASLGGPTEDFITWSVADLKALQDDFYQKNLPTVDSAIIFTVERQAPYQIRAANHDSYILHASGKCLADLYCEHGEQLLQQNIRVYQGDKTTNASIRQTCTGEDSPNFFHFNNGITFLCENARWDQFLGRLTLERAQVVNGGQTLRVLARAVQERMLKSDTMVPVRVITSQGDKEFASNVAVNLNNQNRVESSFLRSNNPRVVQLAHSLLTIGWYLERRQDEVSGLSEREKTAIEQKLGGPGTLANRVIPLKEGTQAYVTTFRRLPELAKKNPQKMFQGPDDGGFFDRIFNNELSSRDFVAAYRIKCAVEAFVQQFTSLKRRKVRLDDWQAEYSALLGAALMSAYADKIEQVIWTSPRMVGAPEGRIIPAGKERAHGSQEVHSGVQDLRGAVGAAAGLQHRPGG